MSQDLHVGTHVTVTTNFDGVALCGNRGEDPLALAHPKTFKKPSHLAWLDEHPTSESECSQLSARSLAGK